MPMSLRLGLTLGGLVVGGSVAAYSSYALALDFKNNQYRQVRTRTNQCTNFNANPTDLTNAVKGGDAASVLSVVSDTTALAAAGLSGLATSGNVYKLDNSAGVAAAWITFGGTDGNANPHTRSAYIRGGTGGIGQNSTSRTTFPATGVYARQFDLARVSGGSSNLNVSADAGQTLWVILNQMEEAPQASALIATAGAAASVTENLYSATPIRTNLLAASNNYSAAVWQKTDTTVDYASAIASPDGYPLALVTEGSVGTAVIQQSAAVYQPQATVTASAVLKRGNSDWVRLSVKDSANTNGGQGWFNLATGAAGSGTNAGTGTYVSSSITSLGNGFYRVAVTATVNTSSSATIIVFVASASGDGVTARVASSTRYQGQSQLEIGTTATAYIHNPNTTAGMCACTDGPASLYGYSYSRTGAKGEIKSDGSIISQPAGVPAIIPGDGYWSRAALTNLAIQSQALDNASWTKSNVTVTADQIAAPDGSSTADLITETTATANHIINLSATTSFAAGSTYTQSVFLKAGTATIAQLAMSSAAFTSLTAYANFDLSNGTVSFTGAGTTAAIVSCGNGWYRCSITATADTAVSAPAVALAFTNNGATTARLPSYTGTSKTLYAWQTQCVLGTQPGPIIVTTSATATVGADTEAVAAPALTSADDFFFWAVATIDQSTGVIRTLASMVGATTSDRIQLTLSASDNLAVNFQSGGVTQTTLAGTVNVPSGRVVWGIRWRAGKATMASKKPDGTVTIGTESGALTFPASVLTVAPGNINGANQMSGKVEGVFVRKATLSDADITALLTAA